MEVRNVGLQGQSNSVNGNRIGNAVNSAGNVPVTRAVSSSMLANMEKGSVFSGDIIDVHNSSVKILLEGNQTITAKAMNNSNLNIGDYIKFMIKDNTGGQVLIKAISVDNSHTNPLMQALTTANIPVNERNMQMVAEMMRNEMPIDKNSINEMYKNIMSFETESASTIVNIVRHDIPLNAENITQFDKYMNYEHRISYALNNIADGIPDFADKLGRTNIDMARQFVNDFVNSLPDSTSMSETQGSINLVADEDVIINNMFNTDVEGKNESSEDNSAQNIINDNLNSNGADGSIENNTDNIRTSEQSINTNGNLNGIADSEDNISAGFGREIVSKEAMQQFIKNLSDNEFKSLINSDKFSKYIKNALSKEFNIDVMKLNSNGEELKKSVKEMYEKLDDRINKMVESLKNFPKEGADLLDKTNSLKQNLSFMNEINQMASYVQLPLHFSESKNHGELYVYNKSHGKMIDKDVLTAFMHLDMDNLGPTDVDIRLESEKLSTKFSLSDEISIDIVEEHLEELKDKLTKAGYNVTLSVTETEAESVPFEKVLEKDRPKMSIKRFSFDVRA
ncbi:MAG: flagellar hook-length control protein FliK [Lachnospiraceae bacterium]|nr:flagellar hook-length control protein FliK [Lachnospiraceae bacterium]